MDTLCWSYRGSWTELTLFRALLLYVCLHFPKKYVFEVLQCLKNLKVIVILGRRMKVRFVAKKIIFS